MRVAIPALISALLLLGCGGSVNDRTVTSQGGSASTSAVSSGAAALPAVSSETDLPIEQFGAQGLDESDALPAFQAAFVAAGGQVTLNAAQSGVQPATDSVTMAVATPSPLPSPLANLAAPTNAPTGKVVRIILHAGRTYHLFPTDPPSGQGSLALNVQNEQNLILEGNGATIMIRNPRVGFLAFSNCQNMTVRNVNIDYNPLPFTQGHITAVNDKKSFEVKLDDGFPSLDQPWFAQAEEQWGLIRDPANPIRVKAGLANVYPLSAFKSNGHGFTITLQGLTTEGMAAGDVYVQLARRDGSPVFEATSCAACTYANVNIATGPAAAFIALESTQMTYRGDVDQPAAGRIHSTCADGIFQVQGAVGPTIEGCTISTNGDDGLIVKTIGANATSMSADRKSFTLLGRSTSGSHPQFLVNVGDLLRVYDPQAGELLGQGHVVAASAGSGKSVQVTLDTAINGVTGPPSPDFKSAIFYDDDEDLGGFTLRNNTLISNRRWGIFCCSHNGVIEGNSVQTSNAQGLMMMNGDEGLRDSGGFAPHDVTVHNNSFTDCFLQGEGSLAAIAGVISMTTIGVADCNSGDCTQTVPVSFQGNQNIVIDGNTITGFPCMPAINITCANTVTVRNNTLQRTDPSSPSTCVGDTVVTQAMSLSNVTNVTVDGNTLGGAKVTVADLLIGSSNTVGLIVNGRPVGSQ